MKKTKKKKRKKFLMDAFLAADGKDVPIVKIFVKNIPLSVKNHFKAACAKRNVSMSKAFRSFMMDFIKRTENPLDKKNLK